MKWQVHPWSRDLLSACKRPRQTEREENSESLSSVPRRFAHLMRKDENKDVGTFRCFRRIRYSNLRGTPQLISDVIEARGHRTYDVFGNFESRQIFDVFVIVIDDVSQFTIAYHFLEDPHCHALLEQVRFLHVFADNTSNSRSPSKTTSQQLQKRCKVLPISRSNDANAVLLRRCHAFFSRQ